MLLLGIDIGSSGPKVAIYDSNGSSICSSSSEFPRRPSHPQSHHELDPQCLWDTLLAAMGRLPAYLREQVTAASISSHGESFVPVASNGRPVAPFILNLDMRAIQEAEEFANQIGAAELCRITGLPPHAMYPLPKIAWLRRHSPAVFGGAAQFLCIEDYLLQRMGVGAYMSESLASRTLGFDLKTRNWADHLLGIAGISAAQLATPVPSGTNLGRAHPNAASELGLPENVSWVAGGHDQACCSLGGGGISDAVAVDGTGTYECLSNAHKQAIALPASVTRNFPTERHVSPETFLTLAYVPAGLVTDWLRKMLGTNQSPREPNCEAPFADLPQEPTGLFFFPHLAGTGTPWLDESAIGAVLGFSAETTQQELLKASIEGITYEMLWNIQILEKSGLQFDRIHAVGGGARSGAWLQIKANIFGREIAAIPGEASCRGAAICAGMGMGAFSSWEEGVKALIQERKSFFPDLRQYEQYRDLFQRYKLLAERLYGYSPDASS